MPDTSPTDDLSTPTTLPPLLLPDPQPVGTNPFLVINSILGAFYVAAIQLTRARQDKVATLGRKMRTEVVDGVLKLHREDDVDRQNVYRDLRGHWMMWPGAMHDARNLAAEFRIPFAEYDPVLKAATVKLRDLEGIIQGFVSNKEVHPWCEIETRLHQFAASTTPKLLMTGPPPPQCNGTGPGVGLSGTNGPLNNPNLSPPGSGGANGRRPPERPKLVNSKRENDQRKLNVYRLVRRAKDQNPTFGAKQLLNHFKTDSDFKDSLKAAGLKPTESTFHKALEWIRKNPTSQETPTGNVS
jgi:hypothetical protein